MRIYLASTATNHSELENRAYKTFAHSLEYIYDCLKRLAKEYINADDFDFFDRDYVRSYFTEDFFCNSIRINCRSEFGEFIIEKANDIKYRFVFAPNHTVLKSTHPYDMFFVCELEILELLD